jgi:hypothetical protein
MLGMVWALSLSFALSALADVVDGLTAGDRAAIRQTIESQIEAFRANDADLAFSFAAPTIQDHFGTSSRFIAMVKRGYRPVYRPREFEFSELFDVRGKPTQRLVVIGPDNDVFSAYYMMQRQDDGSWRISGCVLRPIGDQSI